ncbi:DUF4350 domain-containing protein [Cryptosporangium arvum]|uniref:DUF4350 domain-containing protein n=1 Tax=Cryptosporangium arvum DSM 44712 TaxID=927661 RepID=A0A010ZS00_9ACTN|nr:DUF4350 domain-containing protein [Cryptosporangium arvum]EXG79992.1 hypothetical protein CryarDRAFT_1047 [Cryptosporangium arvum DSM 44712]
MIPTAAPVTGARSPWRFRVILTVVLLALVTLAVWLLVSTQSSSERAALDPDAANPGGTRALSVLLGDDDRPVTELTTTDDAMKRAAAGNVTVVVPFPYNLGGASLRRLAELPDTVRVVFVQADPFALDDLELDVRIDSAGVTETREPDCSLPEATSAGSADIGGYSYTGEGLTRCYDGHLAVLDRPARAELVFLGSGDPFTNKVLAEHGNAALSLGLLNAHADVIWLQRVSPEPIAKAEARSLSDLLPRWIPTALWMLAAAGLLAAFWRGRRLSAPVAEPLPVIVRSTETVEGRARLYRRARARPEAAEALRGAALARLRPVLGVNAHSDPREICEAIAERSGWPAAAVGQHLYGPPPTDDHGLVVHADALDALTAAVLTPKPHSEGQPS